jgi:hypothetical protein
MTPFNTSPLAPAFASRRRMSQFFLTRAPERDQASDRLALESIRDAIDNALDSLRSQRRGLTNRIGNAIDAAAFAAGNDVYEHKTREAGDTESLRRWEADLVRASERLKIIDKNIGDLEAYRAAYVRVFSDNGGS